MNETLGKVTKMQGLQTYSVSFKVEFNIEMCEVKTFF